MAPGSALVAGPGAVTAYPAPLGPNRWTVLSTACGQLWWISGRRPCSKCTPTTAGWASRPLLCRSRRPLLRSPDSITRSIFCRADYANRR